jgi:hypothetical protein
VYTDIFAVGFSATDIVGHTYGADSQEVMDQVLRLDVILGQLFREIEGARGFKMHETYFLSEDGKRLFVIIRVGDPPREKEKEKGAQIVGVNRVYDRVANGGGND